MPDPEQLGPYTIERKIGRGGMGAVYVGIHAHSGGRAAVKVLIPQLADVSGFRERFAAEIDTLKRLDHPNIVRLFGYGEDHDDMFYAMELVNGGSLEDELQRGRRYTWREVAEFAVQLAKALKHAHDHGIIHRDIKPANVLITPESTLKLTDFGIARLFGSTGLTSAGGLLGTAEYMAPEQAEGKPVTPVTDLYSFGGVLYALLAGRPPFRGKTLAEMLHQQRFATPERLTLFMPGIPREFERIVMRLLEKDPDQRFPDATVVIRQLTAMLESVDENAVERPPTTLPNPARPNPIIDPAATQAASDVTAAPSDAVPVNPADFGSTKRNDGLPAGHADRARTERDDVNSPRTIVAPSGPRFTTVAEEARREAERRRRNESPWRSAQTYALLAGLLLIAFAGYWYTRPPTADQLYARISERAEESGPQGLSYVDDDLRRFAELYPNDPRIKQVNAYLAELEVSTAERKLTNRTARGAGSADLSPIEREYLAALELSRRLPEQGLARFRALGTLCEQGPQDAKHELISDLCSRRVRKLEADIERIAAEQLPWIDVRLAKADKIKGEDPAAARAIWQAIIEVYADRPWAEARVAKARSALQQSLSQ